MLRLKRCLALTSLAGGFCHRTCACTRVGVRNREGKDRLTRAYGYYREMYWQRLHAFFLCTIDVEQIEKMWKEIGLMRRNRIATLQPSCSGWSGLLHVAAVAGKSFYCICIHVQAVCLPPSIARCHVSETDA